MKHKLFFEIKRARFILLIFWSLLALLNCCTFAPDHIKPTPGDELFVASDLIEEGIFTAGIEGPAVDYNGTLYAVNFSTEGTIGIIRNDSTSTLYVQLPLGSIGNGIRFDQMGNMLIADYTGHNILKVSYETREVSVFVHQPEMNQPNDLAISSGDYLFASDPNWSDSTGMLWKISPEGDITLLEDSMGTTNGIEVSNDEKRLYVNESVQRRLWVYDLTQTGEISNKKLLITFPDFGLDGMRCDSLGNLFITRYGKGTVLMISPEGKELVEISLRGKNPTNIAFGGPDGRTCFVTVADRGCIETFRVPYPGRSFLLNQKREPRTY